VQGSAVFARKSLSIELSNARKLFNTRKLPLPGSTNAIKAIATYGRVCGCKLFPTKAGDN